MSKIEFKSHKSEILKALDINEVRALTICGQEAVNYAIDNCKAQHIWRTGDLQRANNFEVDTKEKCVIVGNYMDYSPYVEFGTGIYYPEGGRRSPWFWQDEKGQWHMTRGMKPRPFLKPAVADHADLYKRICNEELKG